MSGSRDSPAFVAVVQATAGAAGGVFAALALQPLEVAKTRIQLSHSGDSSTLSTIVEITQSDGVLGLFRGAATKAFETGSKNFVYFYIYDAINAMAKKQVALTTAVKLLLGYIAGIGTTISTMPLEVLATKVQVETKTGAGTMAAAQAILETEGVRGLFKGFWYNILLCVNPAIQNTCFDRMKEIILKAVKRAGNTDPGLSPGQAFILGAIAKAIATLATYPLVRLKTILQAGKEKDVQPAELPAAPGQTNLKREASTSEMLTAMAVRTDQVQTSSTLPSIAELYRGIGSALTKSVLQAALLYMTKDQVADTLRASFKLTSRVFFRRSGGGLKLGVISGRPLAS